MKIHRHVEQTVGIGCLIAAAMLPSTVFAYVGPGAGISVVGSIVAVLSAVFFAIVGFIWYPIRRLLRKRKAKIGADASSADASSTAASSAAVGVAESAPDGTAAGHDR